MLRIGLIRVLVAVGEAVRRRKWRQLLLCVANRRLCFDGAARVLSDAASRFRSHQFLGHRDLVGGCRAAAYQFLSYGEAEERWLRLGRGLLQIGLKPVRAMRDWSWSAVGRRNADAGD